jgi:RNA polymerase sigma-70 factor (ECF subfamily)
VSTAGTNSRKRSGAWGSEAPRYTSHDKREHASPRLRLSFRIGRRTIEDLPTGLADRLRRGESGARIEFFRRYAPQVRRILFLQGYCEEVDDAVQDVFIKVYRSTVPREATLLPWFYRVILNTGRDHGRRRRTRQGLLERLQHVSGEREAQAPAGPVDPALREALAELPADLRECVALRFYADLALDEIAGAQNVPVGTVKSRLHTAMKRLRNSLDERGFDHHD